MPRSTANRAKAHDIATTVTDNVNINYWHYWLTHKLIPIYI